MIRITRTSRSLRHGLARDERGQGVVEFALILPVFILILVGILEFGSIYSKVISMRQGVREAGRQGSVANFGPAFSADCVSKPSPPSDDIQRLICLAKSQSGVGDTVLVRVKFAKQDLTGATDTDPSLYAAGNALIICAVYPLQSLTRFLQPALDGHYARTKAAFRIEKLSAGGEGSEIAGGDTAPPSQDWAWCT